MAKRRRGLDVNGTTTETAEYNTVFVDTSLGTHLAMLVSKSDTVSDFKKKMVLEHMKCFPKIVEIRLHSLKVKRRATFYHMPDSMHIWSAFHGVKGNWFLSVDASGTPLFDFKQNASELGLSSCMKMEVRNVSTNCGGLLSDINGIQTLPLSFPGGIAAKYVVLGMIPEENCTNTGSRSKKKRKMRHTQDAFYNSNFDATTEVLGVTNDQCVLNEGSMVPAVVEKSNIGNIVNCQNHLGSDIKKEGTVLENISPDMMDSKKEFEVCQDVRALEIAVNLQDTSKVGQTLKVASIQPHETHIPEENHYSLQREVEVPSSYKASDQSIPDLTRKESPELTGRRKKRRKKGAKQLAGTNIEWSGIEQNDNGISACSRLFCPISGHIPEEINKDESILYPKWKDVQLEIPTQDADEKHLSAHGNEADFLTSSQTKQTLEAVDAGKRELDEKTQNSVGNALGEFPVSEKEKQILESNQVEKDSDIKAKKKRKKKIHTASNVQENLTVKDQKVGVLLSRTEENLMNSVNSEMEEIHVASSQVLACKSEEKLEEKHEIAVITGDLARTKEDEGEGSNFKQYFVPFRYQDIVGSPEKVEKASQSNMEMKTMKNVAKNGLPSNIKESILYPKGVDVQLELLDGSTLDADEKLSSAHVNEADFMMLTQTKQTLEAVASVKREMDKDNQNFPGNAHADFSVVEKDNQTFESNLVEDSENKDKKAKNKRKKKVLTVSDLLENLTEKDQNAVVGLSTAEESSMSNLNLEMEGIHVTSSQVVSRKSEKNLTEKDQNDGSTLDADEKLSSAHGNEADFMMLTQTKQTLEAVASVKREMDKDNQNFAGNAHAEFSVVQKDNQTVESNLVEKDSENKDKKAKNKRKKKVLTVSDLQENLTEKDQNAGVGLPTAEESSMSNVNLEMEGIHVTSSQVVSRKSEEKLEEKHGIAANTDDLARTAEDQGEGINFKQYFVPCQYQDKVCSPGKVKTASQEMKILKKVEKHGLPSVKEEIISCSKGQDVLLELLDGSTQDADEKVLGAHGNEADSVMLTQTKHTLEAVASGKGEIDKETQYSAVNALADFPVSEKESQILDSDQVEKDSENTLNKDKKAKSKRKKKVLKSSDVQENFTEEEQKVCVGVSTAEGNSMSYINSETEELHVASSQVVSRKSEEKLEEKHEFAINTDDLARKTEDEGERINFKQFFVPCQYQDKVLSPGKMKKASQSNMEMKSLKKVKRKGLSSVSISTEVESSLDLSANQESESKTRARKDSAKRHGDSATTIQKPMGTLAESALPHKKIASFKKSSSQSSEKVPEKREIKMSQSGLIGTNRMQMKTTEKRSLLAGAVFDDNSGESSGDENGRAHLSGSTQSPADSSSTSDYSGGESNLSQDSIRNGSSDAKERSKGRKDKSKLELFAPENMTLHMILRSSKRFKKAKMMVSQDDIEPIEFVPDSRPS